MVQMYLTTHQLDLGFSQMIPVEKEIQINMTFALCFVCPGDIRPKLSIMEMQTARSEIRDARLLSGNCAQLIRNCMMDYIDFSPLCAATQTVLTTSGCGSIFLASLRPESDLYRSKGTIEAWLNISLCL
jgi:hypothetical protein